MRGLKKLKLKRTRQKQILKICLLILIMFIIIGGIIVYFWMQGQKNEDVLIFYHWWISAGEQTAINSLVSVFVDKYPNITVIPAPIISKNPGGGGVAMFGIVKPLVFAREAPDAFQIHAGYEGKVYFNAGLLEPVDNIWESEGLDKVTPKIIQVMSQFGGHYYSVPINIHRTNVIWYNKALLDKNGINPSDLTTWDSFFAACDKLRANGVEYPIQMGTAWTAQHAFDQIIASIGIDFYEDWINGKVTSSNDTRLIKAFEIFKKYMSYVNPDNADLTWDQATARIISGESAFNVMGDWANGEFTAAGMKYNKDYGAFTVPGTRKMYGLVIDAFQRPKYIQHPVNAEKWLEFIASKEGQDIFNPLKGSISVRRDTDIKKYDLYQQSAIFDFMIIKHMFPAVSNAMPKAFEQKEQEVITQFLKDLDINKAAKDITHYIRRTSNDYTIIWQLD